MTELDVQIILYWSLRAASRIIVPNHTPFGWYECDLWRLTLSGYWDEHEIKLTRDDYKAEARKHRKHARLASRWRGSPNRFYYVVPAEWGFARADIPEWAGLKTVKGLRIYNVVRAPMLHKEPAPLDVINRASGACFHRMWSYAIRLSNFGVTAPDPVRIVEGKDLT